MRCIYCFREPPEVTLSEEHVFPEALGAQLVLAACVCRDCNSQIGSYVDSQLTENFLIRMLRLGLCIPNRHAVIRSPLHGGTIKGHPDRRGTFHPNGDGTGQVTLLPLVERSKGPDGRELVNIVAEPHEVDAILRKLQERAARQGRKVRVLETKQETISKPVVVKQVRTRAENIVRALAKIAYELGVYWLGPTYATHVCGLPFARAVVTGVVANIEATVSYFPSESDFSDWEIPSWYHAAYLDVASGSIWVAFRLFNVIEGRLLLVDRREDFPGAQDRWVLLDPLTGSVVDGAGAKPPPVGTDDGTSISWVKTGQDRFQVKVMYRGRESTTTELELAQRMRP